MEILPTPLANYSFAICSITSKSSDDNTSSMSSSVTILSSVLSKLRIRFLSIFCPNCGASSISPLLISKTSDTLSTMIPICCGVLLYSLISTTITQVTSVCSSFGIENFNLRLITPFILLLFGNVKN